MSVKRIGVGGTWQSHESQITRTDIDRKTITRYGLYNELEAEAPYKGAEYDGGWTVEQSSLQGKPGEMGRLAIQVFRVPVQSTRAYPGGEIDLRVNIAWRQREFSIFNPTYTMTGSEHDIALLDAWRNEPEPDLKKEYKTRVPVRYGGTGEAAIYQWEERTLSETDKKIARRILAGQENYWFWYPVVSATHVSRSEPPPATFPKLYTASALRNLLRGRGYIPKTAGDQSWQYMLQGEGVTEEDETRYVITRVFIGALPPLREPLKTEYGSSAFDPMFYGAI